MKSNPKIIYKYRDWTDTNHKKMLINNELYLASPKSFNDPFDCRIGQNFSLLSRKESDKYITDLAISMFDEVERQGKDMAFVIKDFEKRFADKAEFQIHADNLLFEFQNDCYGIFSCSRRWNSILMWSHYSAKHSGICVGLKWEKMMTLINVNNFGKAGDVSYVNDFPEIKPCIAKLDKAIMEKSFKETHSKAKEWKYEKEYRFMKTNPDGLTDLDRIVHVSNDFFSEVILGIAISDEHRNEIKKICDSKGIPVYQAKKRKFKFEICKELI